MARGRCAAGVFAGPRRWYNSRVSRHTGLTPPGPSAATSSTASLIYTDRYGGVWYLHEGRTKTGKSRYFVAREPGEGACGALPPGMEFRESINGVVSVAKVVVGGPSIPPEDVALVKAELARHDHLWKCAAAAERGELVVYEAQGISPAETVAFMAKLGFPVEPSRVAPSPRRNYTAVMKFVPEAKPGTYSLSRYVYRGVGAWQWLDHGSLARLAKEYLRHIGTDAFYEQM